MKKLIMLAMVLLLGFLSGCCSTAFSTTNGKIVFERPPRYNVSDPYPYYSFWYGPYPYVYNERYGYQEYVYPFHIKNR